MARSQEHVKATEWEKFTHWWQDDEHRKEMTIEQAVQNYFQSYPGRVMSLILELVANAKGIKHG